MLRSSGIGKITRAFWIRWDFLPNNPKVTITYFVKDNYKSGGEYVEETGKVKKIDGIEPIIYLEDGTKITMMDVINISGDIFK